MLKKSPIIPAIVTEQQETQAPNWIHSDFIETQNYIYFIGNFKSDLHNPGFATKKATKALHHYFDEQATFILTPIKSSITKDKFNEIKKEYVTFLSKETMAEIRTTKTIYWEKKTYKLRESWVEGYHYYVLYKLKKAPFRYTQRRFIYRKVTNALTLKKTLLHKQLKKCYPQLNELIQTDKKKNASLPPDL